MDVESKETIQFAIDHAKEQLQPVIDNTIREITVAARSIIDETFANVTDLMLVIEPITIPPIVIKVQRRTLPKQ